MLNLSANAHLWLNVVLGLYLAGLLGLSVYASKKVKNEEDYLVAGRSLPLFLSWGALMATWFGTSAIMGASKNAREEGLIGTVLDPWSCSATLLLAGLFFARPLWRMKLFTIGDFYRNYYGHKAEFVACAIQVPIFFCWIAAQFIGLAEVQQRIYGIDHNKGILIAAAITLVYTLIGGMWSVTLTDALQIGVALVGLVALGYATFSHLGQGSFTAGLDHLLSHTESHHLTLLPKPGVFAVLTWLGTWATGLFGNIPGQDLQQRIFAAKDEKTARWACLLASGLYLAFGLIPVALGLASRLTHQGPVEGGVLLHMAGSYLSPPLVIVFVLAVVSIIVSVATSATIAPATILARNLLEPLGLLPDRHLLLDRLCVVAVTLGAIAMAFTGESIMGLLDIQLSLAMVTLFVPLVMGLWGKPRGELAGFLPMFLGGSCWLARYLLEKILLPLPPEVAQLQDYPHYIAGQFPAERVGTLAHQVLHLVALVPADVVGLVASFSGYFLGQWLCRKNATHRDAPGA